MMAQEVRLKYLRRYEAVRLHIDVDVGECLVRVLVCRPCSCHRGIYDTEDLVSS